MATSVAATALTSALRGAVASHMDFEQSMQDVLAVSQATESEMKSLSNRARELGATTKFTATQAGEGLVFLSMAGLEASESLVAIEDALHLAAAGSLELASAADIVTNVMSGLQLTAADVGRIADVMALAAASANTNVEQLGLALSYVGPVGAKAGFELEELAAAIGVLSDNGIQAERAGTGLRAVIASLLNPSGKAAKVIDRLGISLKNADGTTKDMLQVLADLRQANLTAADAVTLFGKRQAAAALVLIDSLPAMDALTEKLAKARGEAEKMATVRLDSLRGDIIKLASAYESLEITIAEGNTGILRSAAQLATGAVRFAEGAVRHQADGIIARNVPLVGGPVEFSIEEGYVRSIAQGMIERVSGLIPIVGMDIEEAIRTGFETFDALTLPGFDPLGTGSGAPDNLRKFLKEIEDRSLRIGDIWKKDYLSKWAKDYEKLVNEAAEREEAEKKARKELERSVELQADNAITLNALNRELEREVDYLDRVETKKRALATVTAEIEDLESQRALQASNGLDKQVKATQKLIDSKMELREAILGTGVGLPTVGRVEPIRADFSDRQLNLGSDTTFRTEVEGIAGARTNAREFARSLDDLATFQDRLNAKQERSRDILREIGDLEEAANLYREFGLEDQAKLLDLQVRRLAYERGIVDELLPKQDEYFTRLEAIGMNLGNALEDVYSQIGGIITQSESWEDVWKRLLRLGAFELFDAFLGRENAPSIFGGRQNRIRPPRHSGGPVTAGNVYPVRPGEMFMSANMDGYIDPNPAQRGGVLIEKGAIQITGYSAEQSEAIAQAAIGQVEQRLAQRQHYSQLHRRNG